VSLRELLRTPGVAGPMAWSLLANVPVTAIALVLVLHVEGLTGRFAPAGAAAAAFALGLSLSAPLVGRLIDRYGQPRVMAPMAAAVTLALLAIVGLPESAPTAVIVVLAGVTGLTMPPGGSTVRALWTTAIADPDRRHAVFALHNAGVEGTYIVGPVLLAGALAAVSTRLAIAVSVAFISIGVGVYLTRPAVRAWRGVQERATGFAGPLEAPAVRVVLTTLLILGIAFGSIEVGVAAAAEAAGHRAWAGPLLGAWGLGSMAGALVLARRPAPADPVQALVRRLAALTAVHAVLLLSTDPLVLGPLLLVAGATIAPALTAALTLLGDAAPAGTLTEAYSWSTCSIGGGLAVGAAVGGVLADTSARGPFVQALVAILAGALLTAARTRTIAAGVVH
jgi:MFS family permease